MNPLDQKIEAHYHKEGLFEEILTRLENQNIDLKRLQRTDIAGVDEFHVRGAAVSKELAKTIDIEGKKVLDMGSGLGGPCRMLADEFNCTATGIDLSPEFVRTANALSKLVGLEDKTFFIQGSAAQLPFEDNSFDVIWTQHVQMNIPDKQKFYGEAHRVLKSGGHFLYYDIFRKKDGDILYPMPWASEEALSFLIKNDEMAQIVENLGFKPLSKTSQTETGIEFFTSLLAKVKQYGPPKLGLNVLMGESTVSKLTNLLAHLEKGLLMLESGVYQK
ncbi:methyltransferase domain-containing protein [Muricauda sp. CAU 1633]|uniref:class I SAM-dependent methyltransferase n=1 Tax=Allomuricauda sp. CAU 1633 TaxID=2816036 RepID=UPI001A8F1ACC|nr:methyltransferase domain-containing protein [Muricauda sp. CAU 1633]MBO0322078.1 methyltransferase domain-containing protein [Muricauda sp. CAU 1633]